MIIACIYILLFSWFIYKWSFFEDGIGLERKIKLRAVNFIFLLKVIAGFGLSWVYTRYYTDRQTADIFKYYDDAKVMFGSFTDGKYGDYFRMLLGFSNDNVYFDDTYYKKMNHWYLHYDYGTYNDNHTIIRFNALVMLVSFGSFHVHTVFMCFLSLIGLMAIYRSVAPLLPLKRTITFISLFLVPSVIFWGSGVLKEGLLLFALGLLFYSVFNLFIYKKSYLINFLLLCLSFSLLMINKRYLLIALVPALTCFVLVEKLKFPKPFLFYLGIYMLAFFGSLWVSHMFYDNKLLTSLSQKHRDFIAVSKGGIFLQNERHFARLDPNNKAALDSLSGKWFRIKSGSAYMYWKNENLNDTIFVQSNTDTSSYWLVWDLPYAGSTLDMKQLEPTFGSLFKTAPTAMYHALAKPGLFSSKSIFEKVAAIENSIFLLFMIVCVWLSRTGMNKNLFSLCFYTSVVILFLIGYTTPVAGAIVRYKVPVWPFMVLCGIVIFDIHKIKFFADKEKTDNPKP